jgi:hypothetical protein
MRTFTVLLLLSLIFVTLFTCQGDTNTIVIIEDTLDWCFDSQLLFPVGTEWTYSYNSECLGEQEPETYRATECKEINGQTWIRVEQIAPTDPVEGVHGYEYNIQDSTIIRQNIYRGQSQTDTKIYLLLDDDLNHPDTLVNNNRVLSITEKLDYFDSYELRGITFRKVSYFEYAEYYRNSDGSTPQVIFHKNFIWFAPGLGIIKEEHHMLEDGFGGYAIVDVEELISYKLLEGTN